MSKTSIAFAVACLVTAITSPAALGGYLPTGEHAPAVSGERVLGAVVQAPGVVTGTLLSGADFGSGGHPREAARSPGASAARPATPEARPDADEHEGSGGMALAGLALVLAVVGKRIAS